MPAAPAPTTASDTGFCCASAITCGQSWAKASMGRTASAWVAAPGMSASSRARSITAPVSMDSASKPSVAGTPCAPPAAATLTVLPTGSMPVQRPCTQRAPAARTSGSSAMRQSVSA